MNWDVKRIFWPYYWKAHLDLIPDLKPEDVGWEPFAVSSNWGWGMALFTPRSVSTRSNRPKGEVDEE